MAYNPDGSLVGWSSQWPAELTVQQQADAARRARQPRNPMWANTAPQWIQGTHGGHLLDNYVRMDAAGQMAQTFGVTPGNPLNFSRMLTKGGTTPLIDDTTIPPSLGTPAAGRAVSVRTPVTGGTGDGMSVGAYSPTAGRTSPTPGMVGAGGVSVGEYLPAGGGGGISRHAGYGTTKPLVTPAPDTDPGTTLPPGAPGAPGAAGGPLDVGYGVDLYKYLDPSIAFQMQQGLNALQNSAAARGNLDSGQTLKDILKYSQGLASTDFGNAFNRATNVRNFNYGADVGDRDFFYGAARDDRNFNAQMDQFLAQLGLSATGQGMQGDNYMSGLIAALMGNAGNISAAGGIGGGNAINNTISTIINQILQNNAIRS